MPRRPIAPTRDVSHQLRDEVNQTGIDPCTHRPYALVELAGPSRNPPAPQLVPRSPRMTDRPPETRVGERRYVSILFADISGYTSMSERLDPEEVTNIVNHCFDVLDGIVKSHGGFVDKHIGDCVMAIFGAPH